MADTAPSKKTIDPGLFSNWIVIGTWWGFGLYHLAFDRSVFVSLLAGIMYFTVSGVILCAISGFIWNWIERLFVHVTQPLRKVEPNWFTVAVLTVSWLAIYAGEIAGTVYVASEHLRRLRGR